MTKQCEKLKGFNYDIKLYKVQINFLLKVYSYEINISVNKTQKNSSKNFSKIYPLVKINIKNTIKLL